MLFKWMINVSVVIEDKYERRRTDFQVKKDLSID